MFNWRTTYHKRLCVLDTAFRNFIVFWIERVATLYATFFPNLINLYLLMYIKYDNIIVEKECGRFKSWKKKHL